MSFFKKLFKGIVAGALVGLTGGLALAGLAGLGVTAAVTGVSIATSALFGAVSGGLSVAATAFTKKQRISTGEVQARTNISVDPQTLGKWIFGETAAGTDIVYAEKIADSEIVHVIAAAAHEIDSFGSLYINDELITLSGSAATGGWANVLSVYRNLGTQTQSALSIPSSGWPSTARGLGIAHYGLKWNFASDNGKTKLSGGIPTRITQVIRGAKVYDPRLDSTNGGSGSQRASDQSTWAWSANWALIVAHYLLGYKSNSKLIYGVGVAITDIDWVSVAAMADVCDTVIDGKAKYKIGGIFAISQDHESIIGQLESAVGGKVSNFGGKYYLWCPHNDLSSVGTLTDADIVADGGIQYTPSGAIENLFNTARGQYVEPSILYQLQPYPEVIESTAVTEDGRDRLLQQDFAMIQDVEIAQRVARELIRRSRFSGTLTVVVGPKGLLLKPFDVITVNFRETNFTNELFRVVSMQYSIGGAVILELLEEDASIYDVTTPLGTSLVQLDPNAYDPTTVYSVSGLALTQVSIAGSNGTVIDGIKISWTEPPAFVEFTEGGYRKSGDSDYIYERSQRGASSGIIAPVQPGTIYEVRVRHVSVAGAEGPYSTASITTGTTTSIGSAVIANGSITNAKLDANAVAANVFASGVQPISIFASVPLTKSTDTIFVTSTGKLYRWNGTAYVKSVDNDDIVSITADKITAGTINAAITTTNILQLSTNGRIYTAGKTTSTSTTAGVFLGHDGGSSYDFAVGDGTKSIFYDGSTGDFTISGGIVTGGSTLDTIRGQAAGALPSASFDTTLNTRLAAGVGYVVSGEGGDYRLNVGASSVVAKHKDASELGVAAYTGNVRTGLIITANGIAMGYNALSGNWVNAVAITSTGDITIRGDITATTGTFSGLYTGTISAGQISADAVNLNSLISNTSKTFDSSNFAFEMGTSTVIAGYQGAGIFRTQKNTSFAFGTIATGSDSFALAGQSTNASGAGYGGAFVNSASAGSTSHETEAYLTNSSQSGLFLHTSSANQAILGNATYAGDFGGDVYVDGDITATGSITPFTGSHDGVLDDDIEPALGDILVDVSVIAKESVNDTLTRMALSNAASQCAIGVYSGNRGDTYLPLAISEPGDPIVVTPYTSIPGDRVLRPEYAHLLDDSRIIGCNSVGEGQINVCGEAGNIAAGDLIVTSSMAGKGMKQADDIIRAKTVAKAREAVTFTDPTQVKMIACIYLCG